MGGIVATILNSNSQREPENEERRKQDEVHQKCYKDCTIAWNGVTSFNLPTSASAHLFEFDTRIRSCGTLDVFEYDGRDVLVELDIKTSVNSLNEEIKTERIDESESGTAGVRIVTPHYSLRGEHRGRHIPNDWSILVKAVMKIPKNSNLKMVKLDHHTLDTRIDSNNIKILKTIGISGNVKATTDADDTSLSSISGDINADLRSKNVILHSTSGDIVLQSEDKPHAIEIDSTSGDVTIVSSNVYSASIRSASGDITLEKLDVVSYRGQGPRVAIQAFSGDIEGIITGDSKHNTKGYVELRSTSGNVLVNVLQNAASHIVSSSISGKIKGMYQGTDIAQIDLKSTSNTIDVHIDDLSSSSTSLEQVTSNAPISVKANTVSGKCLVTIASFIPSHRSLDLDASSVSGTINIDVQESSYAGSFSMYTFSGKVTAIGGNDADFDWDIKSKTRLQGRKRLPSLKPNQGSIKANSMSGDIALSFS